MADRFVRITLALPEGHKQAHKWQPARKLRYNHKDLRDLVKDTGRPIGDLFNDAFDGWPHLLLYGLRWQDLQITLDRCSELIDGWRDEHASEQYPLTSLGEKLLEALNASGFVKIEAEGQLEPLRDESAEGNESPEAAIR
jgi:hypothetical protein